MSWGRAWVLLCVTLAVHVADEALNDFLALYNPTVLALRFRVPWLLLPTFSFSVWLAGLALAVGILLTLSPYAYRGASWLRRFAFVFAAAMIGNGLLHMGASVYLGRWTAGTWSSPLLIAASIYLLARLSSDLREQMHPSTDRKGNP